VAITFPLTLPTTIGMAEIQIIAADIVGESESPFTFEQQIFDWQAQRWAGSVSLPSRMDRASAEEWLAFLLALRGKFGTFLMGDPAGATPRGTWAGTPLVNGASQTGLTLAVDGFSVGATGKKGDWFQLGSGSSSRLYKLTEDFTANGAGQATLDFWPRLRSSPADNDPLISSAAKGIWRLAANERGWTLRDITTYGVSFPCKEAL